MLLTACELRVAADLAVEPDGSGTLVFAVELDDELAETLGADGFDPFAGLDDLGDGWEVTARDGNGIELQAAFADPAGLAARVEELGAGLDGEDPLVLDDAVLTVGDDPGEAELTLSAGLRLPSSTGAEGAAITFDGDDLRALVVEGGDRVVRADLRVVMPGRVSSTDADEVDGRVAVWHLPVGELVTVRVASVPVPDRTIPVAVAIGLLTVTIGAVASTLGRRRRPSVA